MPEIIETDRTALERLCRLPEGADIPADVLTAYWQARRLTNRLGTCGALPASTFVAIGLYAGLGTEEDVPPTTFASLVKRGEVKPSDRIMVRWRDKPTEATFLRIRTDGRVEFQLDEERGPATVPLGMASLIPAKPEKKKKEAVA